MSYNNHLLRARRASLKPTTTTVRTRDEILFFGGPPGPPPAPPQVPQAPPRHPFLSSQVLESSRSQLKPTETVVKGKTMSQCTIDVMSRPVAPGRDVFLHPSEEYGMQEIHGFRGSPKWALPRMVTECHADARPGYNTQKAHEYVDNPSVLAQKVKLLATMIKASSSMLLYTGAGISTSSGIDDYASVGQESLSRQNVSTKPRSPLLAKPTYSHYACTSLYEKGFLKRWLQQNHDGLPQKSGFPQEAMNEIHGAWWDPTNPVVMMSGNLRNDLFEDMLEWENKTDLCLSMGTSMCGMNSDRVFTTCAGKARRGEKNVLGGVIVNLQKTQFDHVSSLRIFARIDDVMKLLLGELNITSPSMTAGYSPIIANETGYEDVFHIAYNEDGHRVYHGQLMTLDLREGARVKLTSGPYAGDEGVVTGKNAAGHYRIRFMHQLKKNKPLRAPFERLLGSWWLQSLTLGKSKEAPIVNI